MTYDDDQLVQLLGRGELTDQQIAERVGISAAQVGRIARGENRPDLHPKICAAMRQTLKAAWKNGGRLDTESGESSPATDSSADSSAVASAEAEASAKAEVAGKTVKTPFDRYLAVELIASGQLTLSQIAKRLGIHKSSAWRIITGRTHPELQGLIREAQRHYRDRARRLGSYWSAQLMMKQIKVGLKYNNWVGLRARQDLLDRFLGPEDEDKDKPDAGQDGKPDAPRRPLLPIRSMIDLSPPLFAAVLKELGGPEIGPEDYENYAAEHKDQAAVLEELDGPQRSPEYWVAYAAAYDDGTCPPYRPDDFPAAAAAKAEAAEKAKSPATDSSAVASAKAEVAGKKTDTKRPAAPKSPATLVAGKKTGMKCPATGPDAPGSMLPIRSMTELSLPLKAAVLKELGGPPPGPEAYAEAGIPYPGDPEDEDPLFADCNDSSAVASPATVSSADSSAVASAEAEASAKAEPAEKAKSPATPVAGKKANTATCHGDSSRRSPKDEAGSTRNPPQSRAGQRRVKSKTCPKGKYF